MNRIRNSQHTSRTCMIAGLAALIFITTQMVSAAHYHSPPDLNHFGAATQAASADQCPICLHQSNSMPALASALPFVAPLSLVSALRLAPERTVALEIRFALFGRAPPATV
jgi:hypothetical protein